MKKRFIVFLSLLLALIVSVSGCSCVSEQPLSFTNAFAGENSGSDPVAGYKETLKYSVTYTDKYETDFAKSSELNGISYIFSDGVYTSILETVTAVPEGVTSDILQDLPSDAKTIYKLTTELNIKAKYENCISGNGEYSDVVKNEVYFCSYRLSYAPIYSKTNINYSMLYFDNTGAYVGTLVSERSIVYNKNSYTTTQTTNGETEQKAYEYTFMTLIDNAQLLFVLRNVDLETNKSFSMPTVSHAYGEAKTLRITKDSETVKPVEINYNGAVMEDMNLKNLSFLINDNVNAGIKQLVSIQKNKTGTLPGNSLLYSYVEPIMAYGSMLQMGALVYTLTDIQIS